MRRWLPATTTSLVLPRKAARLTSPTTLRPLREGRPLLFLEDRNGPAAHAPCDRFLAGRQHRSQLRADRQILRPAHPGSAGDRRRHQTGRAPCRERVCHDVSYQVDALTLVQKLPTNYLSL